MKLRMLATLFLTLLMTTACQTDDSFVLVEDGKAQATIVVARPVERAPVELPEDGGNARYKTVEPQDAARELQEYLKRSTGVALPIAFDDEPVQGRRILVGDSKHTRALGLKNEDFARQEYLVRITPDVIVLMGFDQTFEEFILNVGNAPSVHHNPHPLETFEAVGTHYAVQDFLEKFVGVRWYFMGELGEVVPEHATITVEPVEIRRKPDTRHRSLYISGIPPQYYWEPELARGPGYPPDEATAKYWDTRRVEASVWGRRLKMGGTPMAMNHSFHIPFAWGILRVDEDTYPGRPNVNTSSVDWPLLTNQKVIDGFVETARKYFDNEIHRLPPFTAAGDYFAVIPHDTEGAAWGNHPDTLKWIDRRVDDGASFPRSRSSDYYWPFVAKVAAQVKQSHPDKVISALAYRTYSYPAAPDLLERLPDNVAVGLCLGVTAHERAPTEQDPFTERWIVELWSKVANPELMFQWRYMLWPTNPHYRAFPDVHPIAMGRMVRTMKEFGVRGGVFMQIDEAHGTWWSYPVLDHLRVYVAAKMLDDWTRNENDIVNEYYHLFYGPAEKPMRAFWEYLHQAAQDYHLERVREQYVEWRDRQENPTQELWDWTVKCPPVHIEKLGELFEQGRRLTEEGSLYRKRVELIHDAVYQAYLVRASRETLANAPKEAVEERPRPFDTELPVEQGR